MRFKKINADQWIGYIGIVSKSFMPIYCEIGDIKIIYILIKAKLDELLQR